MWKWHHCLSCQSQLHLEKSMWPPEKPLPCSAFIAAALALLASTPVPPPNPFGFSSSDRADATQLGSEAITKQSVV